VVKKKIERWMINPLIILFLLGILQALLGWIMVASGLNEESLYVDHIRLAIHFTAALGLLCYTLWFALRAWVDRAQGLQDVYIYRSTWLMLIVLVVQLVFGAFMAGLKAANFATTWPLQDSWQNFTHDPLAVHFIHRNLAYLLTLLILVWYLRVRQIPAGHLFTKLRVLPLVLVVVQVVLGILTVLNANNPTALLWLGVAHQFTGMMLLLAFVGVLYLLTPVKR
jgi:cytochrome c oxidase assembly protein subunit 15